MTYQRPHVCGWLPLDAEGGPLKTAPPDGLPETTLPDGLPEYAPPDGLPKAAAPDDLPEATCVWLVTS